MTEHPTHPQPVPTPYDENIERREREIDEGRRLGYVGESLLVVQRDQRVGYRRALSDYGITLPPAETVTLPLATFQRFVRLCEGIADELSNLRDDQGYYLHVAEDCAQDIRDALAEVRAAQESGR